MPVRSTVFLFSCKDSALSPCFLHPSLPPSPSLPSFCPHPLPPCPFFLSPEPDAELAHLTPAHIPSARAWSQATSSWGRLPAEPVAGGLAALLLREGWAPALPLWSAGSLRAGVGAGFVCCCSWAVVCEGQDVGAPPRWRGIFYTPSFESQAQCGNDSGLNGEWVLWLF